MEAVAGHPSCGVCLMHMRGDPSTMRARAVDDYGRGVRAIPSSSASARLGQLGIAAARIVVDRGPSFAKRPEHNLACWRGRTSCCASGRRCSSAGRESRRSAGLTGRAVDNRLAASPAAALAAVQRSARIVRVHDVARQTVDALRRLAGGRPSERVAARSLNPERALTASIQRHHDRDLHFGTDGIRGTVGRRTDHDRFHAPARMPSAECCVPDRRC